MTEPEKKDLRVQNTRMTDTLEFASELQEEFNKKGLAKVRESLMPERHIDFDGENCVSCGNGIPAARLAMEKVRCTSCQAAIEHHRKLYGGRK